MTETDRAVLNFAKRTYRLRGAREQDIYEKFGWSPTRYSQRLGVLLDDPEAYVAEPTLIKRLRRLRDARIAARAT